MESQVEPWRSRPRAILGITKLRERAPSNRGHGIRLYQRYGAIQGDLGVKSILRPRSGPPGAEVRAANHPTARRYRKENPKDIRLGEK